MAQPGVPGVSRTDAPVVIVLAAGMGERFRAAGGLQHKLDAPLADLPVRAHVLAAVQASGLPWHVVEREHTQHLSVQGMGSSIATGVAATASASGWLMLPADLPLIQPETLRRVAQALRAHAVAVPVVNGQRGHPVGFGAVCRDALLALSGDQGAQSVVQAYAAQRIAMDDMGCILDVDTPQALAEAERIWHERSASS